MPKLVPENRPLHVPSQYSKVDFALIVRAICQQVNSLSEGRIYAHFNAQNTVPSGVAVQYAVGDMVRDSNATVRGSVAPGVSASYVRLGWINVSPGFGDFRELRFLTGS